MMSLILQETSVQVKYYSHANLTKKQVKKSCSLRLNRYLDKNNIYRDLRAKLDKSSTKVESLKIYKIRIFRSNFQLMLTCMCRVSFLTTLDIYKAYFKGRYTWRTYAKSALVPYSFYKKLLHLLRLRVL